ncbi:hypothetical protein [Streptomyces sp. WAC05374]|nr:hypothetical protein [Streptomyces sp. WAC05374]
MTRRPAPGHPALPPHVVAGPLADDDWEVGQAAAANPSSPVAVMAGLVP